LTAAAARRALVFKVKRSYERLPVEFPVTIAAAAQAAGRE
jgi:hypothetical protein